jgi:hypothetical protein
MRKRQALPEDELRHLYEVKKMTQREIAKHFGCGWKKVLRNLRKYGIESRRTGPRNGELHPQWKGGVTMAGKYRVVYAPDHPHAKKVHKSGGYVHEHRLIMEGILGRYLTPGEIVHHKDGNTLNNDPENLELFASNTDHLRATLKGKVPKWTDAGLAAIHDGASKPRKVSEHLLPEIRRQYLEERIPLVDLAAQYNCAPCAIRSFLQYHGVPLRSPREASTKHKMPSKDELQFAYNKLEHKALLKYFGVSVGVLYSWLHKYKIPLKESHRPRKSISPETTESCASG